jgi:hypothetical protein
MNFFEKAINGLKAHKDASIVPETALIPAPNTQVSQVKSDIVTKHVLVNPKCALMNYDLFSLCKTVPVAVESEQAGLTGFCDTISLPTQDFLPHLKALNNAPNEVAADPKNRVVYEIKLQNGEKMYIYPNLKYPRNPWMSFERTVAFNVNPELNRAIISVLKNFTRQK